MIRRQLQDKLQELAKGFPALAVTGPRQSGKTTLARAAFPHLLYVSLEDPDRREMALTDPRGFLDIYRNGAILDEVQRTPELFSYLQGILDQPGQPAGRFILTGSQQFGLHDRISQSLAGRVAMETLLPFSLTELYPKGPDASSDEVMWRGFYPPLHERQLNPTNWFKSYVQTYLERDVRNMLNIRDLGDFQRFLRLCAGRSGQLLNSSQLAADTGISTKTAQAWISVLEAGYLVFLLRPHHANFSKRLIKSPKLYFFDTGLLCWLLGIHEPDQLAVHPLRGAVFETMVAAEVMKSRFNRGLEPGLFFWRDQSGREVDLLADHGRLLLPAEVKSGKTIAAEAFTGLEYWRRLAGGKCGRPLLIYGGDDSFERQDIGVFSWRDPAWPAFF
ncbi:MAG: hypothetical protein BWY71_01617 [Planctomycetes bacterium ADurb.Bin412]|nr:MAG: hypothetical protein BWY71_01617 [Planctomycetes bacterium ADurb.Bin412]